MIDAGLILEGGGMRGIYTAGVLDFFIDKNLYFDNVYGVSAGACHGCSYVSKQRGRAYRIGINYLNDRRYCSIHSLITTGDLFGSEMCYDLIPNELDLYDYNEFDKFKGKFNIVITNCCTGKAEYISAKDMHRDINVVWASSSLPLLSKKVIINGNEYLDGGVSDSIPIKKSISDGNKKNIVILTQSSTYRKLPNKLIPLIKIKYKKYPHFIEAMKTRHIRYNETLDFIKNKEKNGEVFVIQPEFTPNIGRIEKDKYKLKSLYENGYNDGKINFDRLMEFLR